MIRPLRSVLGLALVVGLVWCSFRVKLGSRTFAEHVDNIGATPQARELIDGARGTVNPALEEATHRVLGEQVEAPTRIGSEPIARESERRPSSRSAAKRRDR